MTMSYMLWSVFWACFGAVGFLIVMANRHS